MLQLLTIVGARPQIIKASAISRAVASCFADQVSEKILHTGQHYDQNMSQIFFDELSIPLPNFNLGVGSGSHGTQTAKMIVGIEQVLTEDHYDGIIVYGDTNSTLAGAIVASKLHVPIFHIEAGLRSYNTTMPEEINRMVCDQLSTILFAPTQTAVDNLDREGYFNSSLQRQVCNCGDVMYDNCLHFASIANQRSTILTQHHLTPNRYILATIHRDFNTDNPTRLTAIFEAFVELAEHYHEEIVVPLHPRTTHLMETNLTPSVHQRVLNTKGIKIIPPTSYLDIIALEKNAHLVMTDSGGVQKEAFFFETPCIILRPETEWVEIVAHGAGILSDANIESILRAYQKLGSKEIDYPNLFGNGHAAEQIIHQIIQYSSNQ